MTTIRRTALDRLSPTEAHLPPSLRAWARVVDGARLGLALELRDPNDGVGFEPSTKSRHQYVVGRGYLWRRRLPPAPLDAIDDESPWLDAGVPPWEMVCGLATHSPILAWAREHDPRVRLPPQPLQVVATRMVIRERARTAYRMPPAHPWDPWADLTGVPCPVPGCRQTLVWYEAGYVPGYRVCMAPLTPETFDPRTLAHRFSLGAGSGDDAILLLHREAR